MQLTSTTFSNLDENLELRQQAAVQAANGTRFGRLANTDFDANGVFVQGAFEIPQFKCFAVLPNGLLISPDEPVSVRFPRLSDGWAYLTVSLGADILEYEKEGVPYVRQSYDYDILPQNEMLRQCDVLPVVRFRIEEGRCSIDNAFIPPCLMFGSDERLSTWRETISQLLEKIAKHANMKEGDCQQTLLRYLFRLRAVSLRHSQEDFLLVVSETVQAVRYFVVQANGAEDVPVADPDPYDVDLWLSQVKDYFTEAVRILDGVVLVDDSIDFEALKAQLREELLAILQPEMETRIDTTIQALRDDLNQRLSEALREYIDGTFRRKLEEELNISISEALRPDLYDSLYKALYDALFVPQVEEEDNFMPLI